MQFVVKRDQLLKSLNFVQGVIEKKNTLPILSNVLLQIKDKKLSIVATDLDIIFYDEIKNENLSSSISTYIVSILEIEEYSKFLLEACLLFTICRIFASSSKYLFISL